MVYIAALFLDSGPVGFSEGYVQRRTFLHEGRVLNWGHAERSIPVPAGLPRVGDCQIRMADTDRKWRDLLYAQTPRRRLIELNVVHDELPSQTIQNIGVFEVVDAIFPQDEIQITGRDITFAWLDKPIVPLLITRRNFPELPEGIDEAFAPIIAGIVESPVENPQGVIPLPHMGIVESISSPNQSPPITVDRWCVAAHPIYDVTAVYRRAPGDGLFSLVSTGEYRITESDPTVLDGIEYTFTFLDFFNPQDDGTEIRIDARGFDSRGSWGFMPPVTSTTGPLRNPIDFLINLLYVILVDEVQIPRINVASFNTVRNLFDGGSGLIYRCDGAIVESITARSVLSQFLSNFEVDFYQNRFGEIEIHSSLESQPSPPAFDDTLHFVKGSVTSRLPHPTFNRWRYRYRQNYDTGEYASEGVHNNEVDQLALGLNTSPVIPHIEEEKLELTFVRDMDTAESVIAQRARYLALGSYRVEVQMPTAEVFEDLELAHEIAVTHYGGLDAGGWNGAVFKTTDIVHDLDGKTTTVRAVLLEPAVIAVSGQPCPEEAVVSSTRSFYLLVN